MPKRRMILLLVVLCMSLLTAVAQDADEEATTRVWSPIDDVAASWTEIESEDDDAVRLAVELTITGHHTDACDFDLITEYTVYENNIDLQVYREIPITVSCLREDTPFETRLVLDESYTEIPPYLIINDQVWEVTLPEGNSINSDEPPEFEELTLVGVVVEDVTVDLVDGEDPVYELALSGSHGVGCETPLVQSVRQLAETTIIGVFNPVPELAVCPAMIIILDETIEIPATLIEDDTLVTVNEYIINELETQTMSDTNKVMTNINTVNVNVMESMPAQISLDISGEHPDGCDLPVVVDQSRNGNTITVEIYREVPTDMMCPMMLNPYEATIKLNGTFDSGSYTITVNGVTQSVDI